MYDRQNKESTLIIFSLSAIVVFFISYFLDLIFAKDSYLNCAVPFGINRKLFLTISIVSLFVFLYLFAEELLVSQYIALTSGIILGAGLFNLVSRFSNICVRDYFIIGTVRFNISDILICGALSILVIYNLFSTTEARKRHF